MTRARMQTLLLLASVAAIGIAAFNLGWLYGADHAVSTCAETCASLIEEQRNDPLFYARSQRDTVVILAAQRWGVPLELALAVSYAENWSGDPTAVSSAGAVGLMQVMPFWRDDPIAFECAPMMPGWLPVPLLPDLTEPTFNACMGVRLLKLYHDEHRADWNMALRAYNGALRYPRAGDKYVAAVMQRLAWFN